MGTQENKDLVRRYIETISGKPKPEEIVHVYVAQQELQDHIAMAETAFPFYSIEIEMMVAEDDLVSVIGRFCGTHDGAFMGFPPTGRSFDVPFHVTYRIEGRKIVDHWMLMDNAALVEQLGLVLVLA
jgi:predicted ester cyclase